MLRYLLTDSVSFPRLVCTLAILVFTSIYLYLIFFTLVHFFYLGLFRSLYFLSALFTWASFFTWTLFLFFSDSYDPLVRKIARESGVVIFSVKYVLNLFIRFFFFFERRNRSTQTEPACSTRGRTHYHL